MERQQKLPLRAPASEKAPFGTLLGEKDDDSRASEPCVRPDGPSVAFNTAPGGRDDTLAEHLAGTRAAMTDYFKRAGTEAGRTRPKTGNRREPLIQYQERRA